MRARYPDRDGYVDRDGVGIYYEIYENDGPTVVLVPTPTILNSRQWKTQIHYLSRKQRVVTFDGRGNGKSDKPEDVELYRTPVLVNDIRAVMYETDTREAVLVAVDRGRVLAEMTDGQLHLVEGGGAPPARTGSGDG